MKLTKLATLMALASCAYTAPAFAQTAEEEVQTQANRIQYPQTRIHQENRDDFVQGEYGRPGSFIVNITPDNTWTNTADSSAREYYDDGIDHYFTETVVDKYRWLEDVDPINAEYMRETTEDRKRNPIGSRLENDIPNDQFDNRTATALATVEPKQSSEVNDWVNEQNAVTNAYLEKIPYYTQVYNNIDSLMNRHHSIRKEKREGVGEIHYFRAEDGFGRIVYTDLAGVEHELLNERNLQEDGNANIQDGDIYVSEKGSYVAFAVRSGNADAELRSIRILEVKTGKEVSRLAPINRHYVEMEWLDDTNLLYVGDDGGWTDILRHEVGSGRFNDHVEVSRTHLDTGTSIQSFSTEGEDKRYLIIDGWRQGDTSYIKDRKTGKIYRLHSEKNYKRNFAKVDGFTPGILSSFVHLDDKTLDVYFISTENTLKGELIKSNLKNLSKREVIIPALPEYQQMLEAVYHNEGNGYFLIRYMKDATHRVVLMDAKGRLVKDLSPSDVGNMSDLDTYVPSQKDIDAAREKGESTPEAYVSFRYFDTITPRTVYKFSPTKGGELTDKRRRDLHPFATDDYESKHIMYTSKDGTQIPMVLSYKKGTVLNGKNPTVLYGYGGFGLASDNAFRFDRAIWLEHGGIWATAHLRGGEEYGREWHAAGKRLNKMNVFDDFESAADYLFANGYTSPEYLAISGASNGGLLVGAAMTLNPSKYRVALPEVGVLDMIRHADNYHTQFWVDEYGTPYDSIEMYEKLKSYSPYHNVKAGTCYPSTIVMTSKRDDRVTPSHSYKFVAELQDKQACANPTFLYAAENHGHGPNTWEDRKKNYQIVTAFRLNEMGITSVPTITNRPTEDELKGAKRLEEEAKEQAKTLEERQKYLESLKK